jgi:hypothetical protein
LISAGHTITIDSDSDWAKWYLFFCKFFLYISFVTIPYNFVIPILQIMEFLTFIIMPIFPKNIWKEVVIKYTEQ